MEALIEDVSGNGLWGRFTIYGQSIDYQCPLVSSLYLVVSCIEVFCLLGNDFSGLWSQLRSGLYLGYVLHLNFLGGNKSGFI